MKQIKDKNILYVIDNEPYQITEDTDTQIIYVPEKYYSEFVALNPSLTLSKYNYNTIRCTYECEYFKPIKDRYLTIEAITDCTVNFQKLKNEDKVVYYSDDWGTTWKPLENGISVATDKAILLKSNLVSTTVTDKWGDITNCGIGKFVVSGNYKVSGNPLSLILNDNFVGINNLSRFNNYLFGNLFKGNNDIISAKDLYLGFSVLSKCCYWGMFDTCKSLTAAPKLPSTTLSEGCYYAMFKNCTALTTAPKLPATKMKESCYDGMFQNCTALTIAPKLPATTLADDCYGWMFDTCKSLTTAPELPATTLASNCYRNMFCNCENLTKAPKLPATKMASWCYQDMFDYCVNITETPVITIEESAEGCCWDFFYGCSNLKTSNITIKDENCAPYCYANMFSDCPNLENTPELPATTLSEECYIGIFENCAKVNNITIKATDISAKNCLKDWVKGVSATGIISKKAGVTYPAGNNGIPSGWTVNEI